MTYTAFADMKFGSGANKELSRPQAGKLVSGPHIQFPHQPAKPSSESQNGGFAKRKIAVVGERHDERGKALRVITEQVIPHYVPDSKDNKQGKKQALLVGLEGVIAENPPKIFSARLGQLEWKTVVEPKIAPLQLYFFGIEKKNIDSATIDYIPTTFELLYFYYMAQAGALNEVKFAELLNKGRDLHLEREENWGQTPSGAISRFQELYPDIEIALVLIHCGLGHTDGTAAGEFALYKKLAENFTPEGWIAGSLPDAMIRRFRLLRRKSHLNIDNAWALYNAHYNLGLGPDPYAFDYFGAYGWDRDEFGNKYNAPHPGNDKYKNKPMEFLFDVRQKTDWSMGAAEFIYRYHYSDKSPESTLEILRHSSHIPELGPYRF